MKEDPDNDGFAWRKYVNLGFISKVHSYFTWNTIIFDELSISTGLQWAHIYFSRPWGYRQF